MLKGALKETIWWLAGLSPLIIVFSYAFSLYGPKAFELFFQPTIEIQNHDTYYVIDAWIFWILLIVVPIAFVFGVRIFVSRWKSKWINVLALIALLAADVILGYYQNMLNDVSEIIPVHYFNPITVALILCVSLTIATLVGMIVRLRSDGLMKMDKDV